MKIDSIEGRSGLDPVARIKAPTPATSTSGPPAPAAAPHRAPSADSVEIRPHATRRLAVASELRPASTVELRPQGSSIRSSSVGHGSEPSQALEFVVSYSKLLGDGARSEEMAATRSPGVDVSA